VTRTKNSKALRLEKGCHSINEPREVTDPTNEDYRLYVT